MKKQLNYFNNKYKIALYAIMVFYSCFCFAQQIEVPISARVDTSKVVIKKVYKLYKNYLNSKPDSIYKNPFWNSKENDRYLKSKLLRVDRSADLMYNFYNSKQYLNYYKPTVLQIDSISKGRYQIKTIFLVNNPEKEYLKFNPDCITKLYAVRGADGNFLLENCISFDTKNWKKYKFKYINYILHPKCNFNKKEATKAIAFCSKISKLFKIKPKPFIYYVLPNADELGKLYNFEYWLSYISGQTNLPLNEIFTTYSNENFPHEFVHLLLNSFDSESTMMIQPMILTEGIATWLAGAGYGETFEIGLIDVSGFLKNKSDVSLEKIMKFEVRKEFDNNVLYVSGGVLFKFVFDKKGIDGVIKLYKCTNDNYKATLSELLEMEYEKIDKLVIDYIKNYSQSRKKKRN
jgi:hypothetical protein